MKTYTEIQEFLRVCQIPGERGLAELKEMNARFKKRYLPRPIKISKEQIDVMIYKPKTGIRQKICVKTLNFLINLSYMSKYAVFGDCFKTLRKCQTKKD